jgi:hypothetical protein
MSNFFSTFLKDVENIPGELASFFTMHQTQIHTALADAQSAVTAAIAVAAATLKPGANGSPNPVVTTLAGVADGLTKISTAVASAASATTFSGQAANLASLTNSLITSGDVGVKDASSQASLTNAVNSVVAKANTVVGALFTAAAATGSTA